MKFWDWVCVLYSRFDDQDIMVYIGFTMCYKLPFGQDIWS